MRILVVGLGSMGRRRIRLLKKIDYNLQIVGVDNQEERCKQAYSDFDIETLNDLDAALLTKPDCVIISTSPLSHAGIINKCLHHNCHIFTELNLVDDGYDENIELSKKNNLVLFLSSTFLYRDEIQYIRENVSKCKENLNYNYHVGQYLADWHPWESITNYFVGDKRTNGCRELFAIELPWLVHTFGPIKDYKVISRKSSTLPIDYNDNYIILIEHEKGAVGTLAVDVMTRKAIRRLEIYSENLYITWEGTPTTLREYDVNEKKEKQVELYRDIDKQDGYAEFIIENAYENELRVFLGEIKGTDKTRHSFYDDKGIIKLINDIEKFER